MVSALGAANFIFQEDNGLDGAKRFKDLFNVLLGEAKVQGANVETRAMLMWLSVS